MKLRLPNNIEYIPQLSEFIENVCENKGIDMALATSLNLAMEEAVVNVMTYAYPQDTMGYIDIEVVDNGTSMVFIISDSGIPFDPTTRQEVDITLSAEERAIGGLGIHLIRKIMDEMHYERKNDKNILTLKKKITN